MPDSHNPLVVRGTEILSTDPVQQYRQKIARVTLDSMVQFVGLLDANGTVVEINKVALDAVGITLADVAGRPFWTTFWWQVSAAINDELRAMIARAAAGEFVRWDTEIYGRAGGKETIIIDASLMPVKDDHGTVVFICAEGRDITEKKAQERLIAQKNLELQGLLERIRELDEIKTQFFANVSHELRTPLALILGPAQRLVDDQGTITLAERRESAHLIARNARMLLKHVNDLLDLSKLEAGKLKIELQDADVSALVRLVASHFAVLAADRRIDYVVEADDACVTAVDPDKLQRVIMNVLANAFKFVPDGGRVRCGVTKGTSAFMVAIDDSGPGVKPEMRQAIFERFRQAEGGATRKRGGTGLGLAIAKEFVEMHKGSIAVRESNLGGARFEISLPLLRVGASGGDERGVDRSTLDGLLEELRPSLPAAPVATARPAATSARVLVVEDNADMNRFIVQCLSPYYEVASACDGREGLEQALRFRPDLIVSDIMMPNMSGDEMIAELRTLPELSGTPILLLSAKADDELKVKLLDAGAQDFIVKPFAEKDLLVRVRNLIQAHQALAQLDGLRMAAENANRAKDEFLAMLGHELRNPLSPIVTALQLMKLQGPEESERARAVIERQVTHLTRLVDDLLDVSRIARGKVELKADLVEISEVVAKAIEMASPLLEQRNHTLAVQVPRRGLLVDADITRLSQVISNLLTNAAKYTPSGGHITIRGEAVDNEVILRVRDTGIGITPDVLPHIFDLFVQERQAIDRAQGGLGIGLTIVRNLVARHGGTVQVTSEGQGRGSEFTIRLPRATWAEQSESIPRGLEIDRLAVPKNGAPRVLIVDDNEDGAEMLSIILSQKGYDTRVAYDAPAALQIAATFKPATAFIDIGLPVMDGYELAALLRAMPSLTGIRLIALTGYGQEADRRRGREAGFDEHLVKPVDISAVEAAAAYRG